MTSLGGTWEGGVAAPGALLHGDKLYGAPCSAVDTQPAQLEPLSTPAVSLHPIVRRGGPTTVQGQAPEPLLGRSQQRIDPQLAPTVVAAPNPEVLRRLQRRAVRTDSQRATVAQPPRAQEQRQLQPPAQQPQPVVQKPPKKRSKSASYRFFDGQATRLAQELPPTRVARPAPARPPRADARDPRQPQRARPTPPQKRQAKAPAPPKVQVSTPPPAPTQVLRPSQNRSMPVRRDEQALFRREAVDAHAVAKDIIVAEPRLSTWGALLALASLVVVLFAGSAIATVEVTVKAPGMLRAPRGLRAVESTLGGSVTQVFVAPGEMATEGQVLVKLEDARLAATLESRRADLKVARRESQLSADADHTLHHAAEVALNQQLSAMSGRRALAKKSLQRRVERLTNLRTLAMAGAVPQSELLGAEEAVARAQEDLMNLRVQRTDAQLQLADRKRNAEQRGEERSLRVARAEAAVREAEALLRMTEVRAPATGRVESLLAKPGAVVAAGEVLAQIVPGEAPHNIVAFLLARETAFVREGSEAMVEVESLPVDEFGRAPARVVRISSDLAKPEELANTFGASMQGSFVRVELELLPGEAQTAMKPHLRSGEPVLVRLHRRERRVLSLMFDFVRQWTKQ